MRATLVSVLVFAVLCVVPGGALAAVPSLTGVSVDPSEVQKSAPATGTVTLSSPAQGDTAVSLQAWEWATTEPATGVSVPPSVTVPDGASTATFPATALSEDDAMISATLGTDEQVARFIVHAARPSLTGLRVRPLAIQPGATTTGTVTLAYVPAGNVSVALASSAPSQASVPASVTVPAGQRTATFSITGVAAGRPTITATLDAASASQQVAVADPASHLIINEVDYDNVGTDSSEFVEIYNPTASAVSLANLAIAAVNGANNLEYSRTALGAASLPAGGYLVVAPDWMAVAAGAMRVPFSGGATDQLQNGAPDGVALINTSTHALIDALSYEGAITSAALTGFPAPVSLVEGSPTAVLDSNTSPGSVSREPDGVDTDAADVDWAFMPATPGSSNDEPWSAPPPPPPPPNAPPAFDDLPASVTVVAGQTLTLNFHATDPDGDLLAYAITEKPATSTASSATRTFTWTPVEGEAGGFNPVTFQIDDGAGHVVHKQVLITVLHAHMLTALVSGAGAGTVTSDPAGLACPGTCERTLADGSAITLTATPASGSHFAGWSGACAGTGTCSLTMSADRTATASFALDDKPAETPVSAPATVEATPPAPISTPVPISAPAPKPAPNTSIKSVKVRGRTATARFTGTGAGALSYQCKLDKGAFRSCRAPKAFKALKRGRHTLQVRARTTAGVVDATPAKKTFKV